MPGLNLAATALRVNYQSIWKHKPIWISKRKPPRLRRLKNLHLRYQRKGQEKEESYCRQ